MATLSRRKMLAAVAVAPLIGATPSANSRASDSAIDPVIAKVRTWIATKERQDGLVSAWQDLENRLCDKIRPLGMGLTQASRSALPEARQMRSLMRQIRLTDRKLDRAAGLLVLLRAKSPEGALAKIEMGLRIQEPLDCEEHAWALLQSGFAELSSLLHDHSALHGG